MIKKCSILNKSILNKIQSYKYKQKLIQKKKSTVMIWGHK